jgi:hypothetical protein
LACAPVGEAAFNHTIPFLNLQRCRESIVFDATAVETHKAPLPKPLVVKQKGGAGIMHGLMDLDRSPIVAVRTNGCE